MVMVEKIAKNGVVVDVSKLTTMRQIKEWQEANSNINLDEIANQMTAYVKSWNYAGDPQDVDAYMDLTPQQWRHVLNEVTTAIGSLFQE